MSYPFKQAKNYTKTNGRQIDLVVIHDMEAPEKTTTAEAVANYFAGPNAPRASAHYCCDVDSTVQCVRDQDVAWHAPGASHNGIGVENAGYARQSRAEWLDLYSATMLKEQTAPLTRMLCDKYNIPRRFVDRHGLLRGERGITTHHEVSQAFKRSTHWDPGPNFPMDQFIEWVGGAQASAPPAPPAVVVDDGLLRRGDKGTHVKEWQTVLVGAGHKITVDGDFGPATEAATKAFQQVLGVTADGIVGPTTRAAVARLLAWIAAQNNKPKPDTVPPFPGVTKRGSRGGAVRIVQQRFRDRGWKITVDGDFGPGTEAVVKAFQKEKGLAADGIVGPNTWRAMWASPVT